MAQVDCIATAIFVRVRQDLLTPAVRLSNYNALVFSILNR